MTNLRRPVAFVWSGRAPRPPALAARLRRGFRQVPPGPGTVVVRKPVDHRGLESTELTVGQMGIGSVPPNDADHVTGVAEEPYLRKLPAADGHDILERRHGETG